jgi:acyl-CoA reductase-like NAD-dependent aldehyde dehydrogenase
MLYIGGDWITPSSGKLLEVRDSATEEVFLRVAEAGAADIAMAVGAARDAFDSGPWPRLTHQARAEYLRALAAGFRDRAQDLAQIWPRQTGALYSEAQFIGDRAARNFEAYAALAETYAFEEPVTPKRGGKFGLLVREPVGTVAAIITWNSPLGGIAHKVAPALLAGCTVIVKLSPEAPGEGYVFAEIAGKVGLPAGVVSVVTADREASDSLVRDSRVDKVSFTGSTATGRQIASACADRIARYTLELGGKSAAVVFDDANVQEAAATIADAECRLTGQVCTSLTRIIVTGKRHDEMVDRLADAFAKVRIGDPFDDATQMGPVATSRQRERVETYISKGIAEGATLATGGGRPAHLTKGWFIEPTVFGNVDNSSTIARDEIFGPVLSVIPANDEDHAIWLANDTIYGLNASVFTDDAARALGACRQLRCGTVGHNGWRTDFDLAVGGFKQSGIGRQGIREGLGEFLETKTVILDCIPPGYELPE